MRRRRRQIGGRGQAAAKNCRRLGRGEDERKGGYYVFYFLQRDEGWVRKRGERREIGRGLGPAALGYG